MPEFEFLPLAPVGPAPGADDTAAAVVASARAEADAIRAAAQAEGFAAGREEALAALRPAAAAFGEAAVQAHAHADAAAAELETEAVDLAFSIAEKILAASVAAAPSSVLEAVRGALRGIVERERVTLLVNPDDLELVRESEQDLRATLGGIEHCDVQAERRVGRGGVIVRYAEGQVDARLETKLERAREVVAQSLGSAG